MFKTTDERLMDLGFIKIEENTYGVKYERYEPMFDYTHSLDIMHKRSGKHIIQSYEKQCNSDKYNNVVGLTELEAKLVLKKLKEMKKKYHWEGRR